MKNPRVLSHRIFLAVAPLALVLSLPFPSLGAEAPAKSAKKILEEVETLKAGAEAGDPQAEFRLGLAYWYGKGVKIDYKKAVELYQKAVAKNHGDAWAALGAAYKLGHGVEKKDEQRAADCARKAAELGSKFGATNYGLALLAGEGVEANTQEGLRWLTKAADEGFVKAQLELANIYTSANFGVGHDDDKAKQWARKAADQEDPAAMNLYGAIIREKGDPAGSIPYFEKAADKNNMKAWLNLGIAYFYGKGVERDPVKGMSWWFAGEILGDRMCALAVERDLPGAPPVTEEQIGQAKKLGAKIVQERGSEVQEARLKARFGKKE